MVKSGLSVTTRLIGDPDVADRFAFGDDDFVIGPSRTVIRRFDADGGDRIVDETGTLRIVATGEVDGFAGTGTLLANRIGNLVFLRGVELGEGDILSPTDAEVSGRSAAAHRAAPDHAPADDAALAAAAHTAAAPARPVRDVKNFVAKADLFDLRITKSSAFFDGTNNVELFDVHFENKSSKPIANIEELHVRLLGSGRLDVTSADNATYSRGVFSPSDKTIPENGEDRLFGFRVNNRPTDVTIDSDDLLTRGYVPETAAGDRINAKVGFQITVRTIDPIEGGASAEVFIRNVGDQLLKDLDNLVFRFTDSGLRKVTTTWGADYSRGKFSIDPWAPGVKHGDIESGDKVKLFGFSYLTDRGYGDPTQLVDTQDFRLTSNFDDLIS